MASGGTGVEVIDVAGQLAALGLDPFRFLNSRDMFERSMLQKLAERIDYHTFKIHERLAITIANEVAKKF